MTSELQNSNRQGSETFRGVFGVARTWLAWTKIPPGPSHPGSLLSIPSCILIDVPAIPSRPERLLAFGTTVFTDSTRSTCRAESHFRAEGWTSARHLPPSRAPDRRRIHFVIGHWLFLPPTLALHLATTSPSRCVGWAGGSCGGSHGTFWRTSARN
jgi:hypothetical protein